jgi:hypothetical protein
MSSPLVEIGLHSHTRTISEQEKYREIVAKHSKVINIDVIMQRGAELFRGSHFNTLCCQSPNRQHKLTCVFTLEQKQDAAHFDKQAETEPHPHGQVVVREFSERQ